ncbi:hypothetical protein F4859DRAFT_486597 [Xylaria cf. heliscus]|nr:hypothetical protein F4859DRAFT_486597 [Xylaria cf. heliscus]
MKHLISFSLALTLSLSLTCSHKKEGKREKERAPCVEHSLKRSDHNHLPAYPPTFSQAYQYLFSFAYASWQT